MIRFAIVATVGTIIATATPATAQQGYGWTPPTHGYGHTVPRPEPRVYRPAPERGYVAPQPTRPHDPYRPVHQGRTRGY